jgi:CDP-diacylglycerol--glycerol-3-phosphate 3-phosphatidyltransferase
MVACRAALGLALPLAAVRLAHPEPWLGTMLATGLLLDIYDGILARRWGTDTAALRISDSAADTAFFLGVLVAIVVRDWPPLHARLWLLAALLILEITRWVFDWAKFRRLASYHTYASKFWAILMVAAAVALLCVHGAFWLVTLALAWGIACDLEGLAMSLLLPVWTRDVKSIRRAVELRKEILSARDLDAVESNK